MKRWKRVKVPVQAGATAIILAVLLGGALAGAKSWNKGISLAVAPSRPDIAAAGAEVSEEVPPESVAMRYARAVRDGNTEDVIDATQWMNERLERMGLISGGPEAVDAARGALARQITNRPVEGNQLRRFGIEDQYLFAPGVRLEEVGWDAGRTDLDRPVHERTWIRVTYPRQDRALLDEAGRPIHSLEVGVNVSEDGKILKAGVIGNLDINRASLSYDWALDYGEEQEAP